MPEVVHLLTEAAAATRRLPTTVEAFGALSDDELMGAQRVLADTGRQVAAAAAVAAAVIAYRSRPELGYAGLAQRTGARTPESLVQQLTGSTGREAATLVRVGNVMHEAERTPPVVPPADGDTDTSSVAAEPEAPWDGTGTAWLTPVGRAVATGALTVDAADAIRAGLGTPSETVTVGQLTLAAQTLVADAARLNVDQLLKRARGMRDEIDLEGVAERERVRRERQYLRIYQRRDGMIGGDFLLAPETGGAEVLEAFQQVTSPRRGGPRFIDETDKARAKQILDDPRTNEQLNADALIALIKLGVDADPGQIVGSRKPAVRVLVPKNHLHSGTGIGRIEGHPDAISIDTVHRNICDTGIVPILFDDDGQCINVGREQRLFTTRQRIGLAARDGGCRFPGCDRPPSWCEAHHLNQWHRDTGNTDLADGILLCRHHHMLLHNNHWHIRRHHGRYLLIPPREHDPQQTPIDLPTKSAALGDLYRRRKRAG